MSESSPKKGGKNLTTSAVRKAHYSEYKVNRTREKHKIKRVLKSSGYAAAEAYARPRAMTGYLSSLIKKDV